MPAVDTTPGVGPEVARLAKFQEFDILDTPNQESLDRVARLICQIFGVATGIVWIADARRQWCRAAHGLAGSDANLSETFCRHTMKGEAALVVPDAAADPRFAGTPAVTGAPGVRFYAGVPLRTRDGHTVGTLCAMDTKPRAFGPKDVAILEDLTRVLMRDLELSKQVAVDEVTGALSRAAFMAEGRRHTALAARAGEPVALIAFDLDQYRAINDTQGHPTGDRVLAATGRVCRAHLRGSDVLGRLGGGTFAIVLPKTDLDGGVLVAGRLRDAIAALSAEFGFPLSASFGVASRGGKSDQLDDMLERAEQAKYAAKRDGRNRVVSEARAVMPPTAPRRRVLKAGKIRSLNGWTSLDCTVRSLGEDGATLSVASPFGIPTDFILAIPGDRFEAPCHVTGKSDHAVEVRFAKQ